MTDTIVLRFDDLKTNRLSWHPLGRKPSPTAPVGEGSLEQAARQLNGFRLLAVIPSGEFLLTKVKLPSKNKQRLIQAIPFALENDLTEDIDQLHFAHDAKASGEIAVVTVSRTRLSAWLERLIERELNPLGLFPGVLCLPLTPKKWSAYIGSDLTLVRTGLNQGFSTDTKNLSALLTQALNEAVEIPTQLDLFIDENTDETEVKFMLEGIEIIYQIIPFEGGLTRLLAENLDEKHVINLLQADFKQVDKKSLQWRKWLPAAALFFIFVGTNLTSTILDYTKYKQQNQTLSSDIRNIFRQTFPEIKRIVDPKVQMEQQLSLLKQNKTANHGDFFSLLAYPASIIKQSRDSNIESISYRDGQLDLKMILKDLQSLDDMKKKIEAQNFSVEIRSANANGNQITSHLRIKQGDA